MVLRFLMLLALFVFSCADYERDNIHDRKGKDFHFQFESCGEWNYDPKVNKCNKKDSIIESKCGSDWYDASKPNLRCQSNVIETMCGSGWYNASDANLRCQSNVIETRCDSSWYDASKPYLRCQDNVVETRCGSDWYDASKSNFHCQSNVVETRCGSDWYDASDANLRCQSNVIETMCGSGWYNASNSNLRCQSDMVEARCGNNWYNTSNANLKCQNNVLKKLCDEDWFNVATDYCSAYDGVTEYTKLTDTRDGKIYKTLIIYDQTWMAENLNYNTTSSKCYDDNEANCNIYGRLYNWEKARTVCPSGWRLPEDEDWANLTYYFDTDDYGFAPLPGGRYSGDFSDMGNAGFWWSATPSTTGKAYGQNISFEEESYSSYSGLFNNSSFLSVRCIMIMAD